MSQPQKLRSCARFLGYRIGAQRTKRHFIRLIAKRLSQRSVSQGD